MIQIYANEPHSVDSNIETLSYLLELLFFHIVFVDREHRVQLEKRSVWG